MLISNCKTWNLRSTNEGAVKSYVPKLLRSRAWIPQAITDLSGRPTKKKQGLMFFTLKRGVVKSAVRLRRSGRLRKREIGRSVNGKAISERKKRADDAIQRINCYLVDLCWQILMLCPRIYLIESVIQPSIDGDQVFIQTFRFQFQFPSKYCPEKCSHP